ncbi:FAD-binding oxidoreductase [Lacisediminimonas sp.]|uniref:NAD(P)/FAD-dependent oxidoreductase n=1 Tax=Lacisediminimonas sp. TaxID=3060582 RepID=UPI00271D3E74|nr:FAD-binding oxidoreductase [Lacisediminimonas sp.]MDO8300808.1 FAD-binding oxidoreductase [Lacisediminimonas sp.]
MFLRPQPVRQPHAASYWAATATAPSFAGLVNPIETEVAIIGGGFTGLSAAHHLRKNGRRCVILEASEVGWGASGRNGGMAVPRYKLTFPELEKKYGRDVALRMYRLAHDGVDTLEEIIHAHRIDCGFGRCGHITPIVGEHGVRRFAADVEWLQQHAGDGAPSMLGRSAVIEKIGSDLYQDGYLEPRGAGIHPLQYCNALASSLANQGAGIYCGTTVTSWRSNGEQVEIHTPAASVRARELIIATNGYSNLTSAGSQLEKRIVPIASAVIATEVLPPALRNALLAGGQLATDSKRLTNYYRILADGSFFFGGRGGAGSRASPAAYERLRQDMLSIFPMLQGVGIRHRWFGLVAVTLDSLPRIGKLAANVHYGLGYNGRGVGLAALVGKQLAAQVAGEPPSMGPISDGRFDPIPLHGLRRPAKQAAIWYHQVMDRFQR